MRERGHQVVCVVSGMRGPLYSLWRSVPAIFIHGNIPNHHQKDKISLPSKMHLDRCLSLVRPTPPYRLWPPSFSGTLPSGPWCWYIGAGALLVGLVCQVGLYCMLYAGRDLLRLFLHILCVFFLFRTCAPENINLQKQLWS